MVKLVHNAKKNRYIRTHFSFSLATLYLLSYPLQSFGGKFRIVNFYKKLDFQMVPLKFVCKIHHHYYSKLGSRDWVRFGQWILDPNCSVDTVLYTMWKFYDFSITHILHEINFADSRCAKHAILTHSGTSSTLLFEG